MTETFRVKVRIKRFKFSPITDPYDPSRIPPITAPWTLTPYTCPRCGMKWTGPMGYACPHGQMCGVPLSLEPHWHGAGWISTPAICGSGSSVAPHDPRQQLWN